jgi:hypothetical protein
MGEDTPLVEISGLWKVKALERHRALGLKYQRMLAWYDAAASATTPKWQAEQTAKISRPPATLADVHPFFRFLNEGTDTALVQICEIGMYLEAFKADPAYGKIISDLVSPKFLSTVFELAMAYRWRRAGASVELQPTATAGRVADFAATISDAPYLIETSNIPPETYELLSFRMPLLVKRTAAPYLNDESVLQVKLSITSVPGGPFEQVLASAVKACCHEVSGPGWEGHSRAANEIDGHRIEVERFVAGAALPEDGHWDVRADQVTEETPHRLQLRILVRMPSRDSGYASRIAKKLVKEMKQLSGIRSARVVVLDVTGIEPNALDLQTEALRDALQPEITKKPALASVWLLSRIWTTAMRFGYWGLWVPNPNSTFQIPSSFVHKFVSNERSWDFLSESELPQLNEDEARRSFLGRQPIFEGYIDRWS